jgi:hypothetical protein
LTARVSAVPFSPVEDLPPMLIAPLPIDILATPWPADPLPAPAAALLPAGLRGGSHITCVDEPDDEEEDLGDEEDLATAQPAADEESSFDDFDDEFDDDFEEEENDPDWDHPDDSAPEAPPPGKGGGRKK